MLTDVQWDRIAEFLRADRRVGRKGRDDRLFIEAVLWWRRTGVPWRDLPVAFGPWKTVFNRFDRWSRSGKWERLFAFLRVDVDNEWQSLDSTVNRVHQHGCGAKGGLPPTGLGGREAGSRPRSTGSWMPSACR